MFYCLGVYLLLYTCTALDDHVFTVALYLCLHPFQSWKHEIIGFIFALKYSSFAKIFSLIIEDPLSVKSVYCVVCCKYFGQKNGRKEVLVFKEGLFVQVHSIYGL